jgi:hypothetical protein
VERIHRGSEIRLVTVPPDLLAALAALLDRNNRWNLSVTERRVTTVCGAHVVEGTFATEPLVAPTQRRTRQRRWCDRPEAGCHDSDPDPGAARQDGHPAA